MPLNLKIIIGSTRPGRGGPKVAAWVHEYAKEHSNFDVELIDLADFNLPLLDESAHPAQRNYQHDHTKKWSRAVGNADAFIFVTPEYDFFPPASLVNAVQCLYHEWTKKPAGIVSYGGVSGGLRSAQALRQLLGNINMVPLAQSVPIPFYTKFIDNGIFRPNEPMMDGTKGMILELQRWAECLKPMRESPTKA